VSEPVGRDRSALALGAVGILLAALFWLAQPPVGAAWVALGLLPSILGLVALRLTRRWTDGSGGRVRARDRSATVARVLAIVSLVAGFPSLLLTLWVVVLVLESSR
jgi:hypothetical protein